MSTPRKPGYKDHLAALAALKKAAPAVVAIYGESDYLLEQAVAMWRAHAARDGATVTSLEAQAVDDEFLATFRQQAGMFEPSTYYLIRRAEQVKSLGKTLKQLAADKDTPNRLAIVHRGESWPAPLRHEMERVKALTVPCYPPWPSDVPPIVTQMAEARGLRLRPDAVRAFIDSTGSDLALLANELDRLALVFHGRNEPLDAPTLAAELGMLREDDAWQLDRLLLGRQWSKASILAHALMDRGEEALGLLHIVVSHCRNALKVAEGFQQGLPAGDVAQRLKLPPFLAKQYVADLRGATPERYRRTLLACQAADMTLKSKSVDRGLVIAGLLDSLAI
jgi:DNA polymerase III delta subunit